MVIKMSVEEEYQDVLQNLEFALVNVYRRRDEMTDWEAHQAINGLIRTYTAEQRKRSAPDLKLNDLAQEAYDSVKRMCEFRLGREPMTDESGKPLEIHENMPSLTVSELIACLKRIRKSIEMWQKEGGRRGYFEFVNQFIV